MQTEEEEKREWMDRRIELIAREMNWVSKITQATNQELIFAFINSFAKTVIQQENPEEVYENFIFHLKQAMIHYESAKKAEAAKRAVESDKSEDASAGS
jgi:hypothetical protein